MSMVLSEDQRMLAKSAEDFLQGASDVSAFRALRDNGLAFDAELWQKIVELGWTAIAVPEDYEGLGFGISGLGLIAIEVGRHLLASPLLSSSAIGVAAINASSNEHLKQALLPAIAVGEHHVTFAYVEGVHADDSTPVCSMEQQGDGYDVSGTKQFVAEASYADSFLVLVADKQDKQQAIVRIGADVSGLTRTSVQMLDSRDYGSLQLDRVRIRDEDILCRGDHANACVAQVKNTATIITACELYGCAEQLFMMTVRYLSERRQYGRTIGSFQALQHRAAHLFSQLQLLKSVVYDSLHALEHGRKDLSLAASHVKSLANDIAQLLSSEAIQMHGGIGITDELDVGLYFKRLRVLSVQYGDSAHHKRRFASLCGY